MKFGLQAGIGSFIKALWVFVLFAFSARILAPPEFALFGFWLTVSFVAGLLFDLGQQIGLLSKFSRNEEKCADSARMMSSVKYSTIVIFVLMLVTINGLEATGSVPIHTAGLALLAAIAGSQNILLCIPSRSRKNYIPDMIVGSSELTTAAIGMLLVTQSDSSSAHILLGVFAVARLFGLAGAIIAVDRQDALLLFPLRPTAKEMKSWVPYFVHMTAGTLIINIDLLMTKLVLGPVQYGIYQGGMRLVHAVNIVLTALNNSLIPGWSQSDRESGSSIANASVVRLSIAAVLLTIVAVGLSYAIGHWLVVLLYGSVYAELALYLPAFSILVGLRLVGSVLGSLLSCRAAQLYRTGSSLFGVAVLTLLLLPIGRDYSVSYVIVSQLIAHICMTVILIEGVRRRWRSAGG